MRHVGVDVARGAAVVSMFIAHTAPSGGPGGVLMLSEYLTFPLFALLIGVGAEFGGRSSTPREHFVSSVVRAGVLCAVGWFLPQAGAYVVIVLAPLGVLTLLCWALTKLPDVGVAGVVLISGVFAPWSISASQTLRTSVGLEGGPWEHWFLDLWVSPYYPQLVLLAAGGVGVLLTRRLLPHSGPAREREAWVWALGLATVAVSLLAGDQWGWWAVAPYDTTAAEILLVLALAGAVLCGAVYVGARSWAKVLTPVAWVGGMTLTLYVAQVGWLALWARVLHPGVSDDAWANVAAMTAAAFVFAALWRALRLPGAWRRGPVEGVVGSLVAAALRLTGAGALHGAREDAR